MTKKCSMSDSVPTASMYSSLVALMAVSACSIFEALSILPSYTNHLRREAILNVIIPPLSALGILANQYLAAATPGNISPTTAQQTMSQSPPLLRLAASPHDAHLLATFSQDSSLIRILDVRQPGQALLELRGHASAINCIDWSPSRRGTLASGGDDSLVLIWDLLNQSSAGSSVMANGLPSSSSSQDVRGQGPVASWTCDYEVGNLSWAPQSGLTSQSQGDWLGVSGGRGIWGVSM